jgi:hypothetical protein
MVSIAKLELLLDFYNYLTMDLANLQSAVK